ncbi:MAG: YihY/virulence factor BrkB family protein [Deltaproteobacteria bacterium]|nr:YihY/virulence factor BrkB family protein [Deltaproteobacteria bacterium]MBI4797016.1 YihY/virulence factor BrkB family protein [Deltaproteobacteria bacterium]
MTKTLQQFKGFFSGSLWRDEGWSPGGLLLLKVLRVLILAGRGLGQKRSLVRASALAYSTVLALIPLLALLFALLKGLGIQRLLAGHLLERLAPGSKEFAAQIFQYIENTRVTSLGVFGVVVLLLALVVVMTNVEQAFNETWKVSQTRPWRRKLSDYLSIFMIFPILMAGAISFSTAFIGHPEIRRLLFGVLPEAFYSATTSLVSLGVLWLAFTFIYVVMPNTQVRLLSALLGGIIGGSMWQLAQWIFAWFQGAATYYNAIYGALYHLLFLVIWMFWSWLIVLFGTEVAYAHQHLDRLTRDYRRSPPPPEPVDEYLALAGLAAIGARFQRRQEPLSLEELGHLLPRGNNLAVRVAQVLQDCNLVIQVAPAEQKTARFLPTLPLDQITVKEVLDCLRRARYEVLALSLEGEPDLAASLKALVESAPTSPWLSLSLQELVDKLFKQEGK